MEVKIWDKLLYKSMTFTTVNNVKETEDFIVLMAKGIPPLTLLRTRYLLLDHDNPIREV